MSIPLNINWQQILLHLLNFALLAGGLHLLLYKPVKKFMEQRTLHYQEMDQEAERLKQEAESLKTECQEQLRSVDQEIRTQRSKAQEDLLQLELQYRRNAEKAAGALLEEAAADAERYREKAMRESRRELQELAALAAEKLALGADGDAVEQFLNAAERESAHGTAGV